MDFLSIYVGLIVVFLIFGIVEEIARRWLWANLFKKSGEKRWKAWVPVVDLWTVFKLGGYPGFLSLGVCVLILSLFLASYSQTETYIQLIILALFLPLIVMSVIAVYRINRNLGLPGAYFWFYLIGGELLWLIIARIISLHPHERQDKPTGAGSVAPGSTSASGTPLAPATGHAAVHSFAPTTTPTATQSAGASPLTPTPAPTNGFSPVPASTTSPVVTPLSSAAPTPAATPAGVPTATPPAAPSDLAHHDHRL